MMANPENPPKLDWAYYKKFVPIPSMVDNFQKQYESLKVPYPPDTASHLVDAQEKIMVFILFTLFILALGPCAKTY